MGTIFQAIEAINDGGSSLTWTFLSLANTRSLQEHDFVKKGCMRAKSVFDHPIHHLVAAGLLACI